MQTEAGIRRYDEEAELFHGEDADLRDVITFQGKSVAELVKAFAAFVEDYLAFCRERGEQLASRGARSIFDRRAPAESPSRHPQYTGRDS